MEIDRCSAKYAAVALAERIKLGPHTDTHLPMPPKYCGPFHSPRWVLGSEAFRERMEDLAGERARKKRRDSYADEALKRHDQRHAESLLGEALERLGLEIDQVRALKKKDIRKQALACLLKSRSAAGNGGFATC